jgi:hypothetical protein
MRDRHNRQARSANSLHWRVPDRCNTLRIRRSTATQMKIMQPAWPGPGGFLRCPNTQHCANLSFLYAGEELRPAKFCEGQAQSPTRKCTLRPGVPDPCNTLRYA